MTSATENEFMSGRIFMGDSSMTYDLKMTGKDEAAKLVAPPVLYKYDLETYMEVDKKTKKERARYTKITPEHYDGHYGFYSKQKSKIKGYFDQDNKMVYWVERVEAEVDETRFILKGDTIVRAIKEHLNK